MALNTLIIGDSSARVWGMSGAERLRRQLAEIKDAVEIMQLEGLADEESVLLLRGDHLFDPRLLCALTETGDDMVLVTGYGGAPVAARVHAKLARAARADLAGQGAGAGVAALKCRTPSELVEGFQKSLRKNEPPHLFAIAGTNTAELELELFGGAYK
ncbi:MAG: CDP-alcohol phosphatidyltransferase family protein, partial [Gammaproteobacteria bacterium]